MTKKQMWKEYHDGRSEVVKEIDAILKNADLFHDLGCRRGRSEALYIGGERRVKRSVKIA